MAKLTGFAATRIPGPEGLPFVGLQINALRLLVDPIRRLTAMRRAHGDLVAVARGNPAVVCAFGAALNRDVLGNSKVFETDDAENCRPLGFTR